MSEESSASADSAPDTETSPDPAPEGESAAFDRRSLAKGLVGFTIAGLLLYLLGSVVGWEEIITTLADADPLWVAIACLSTLAYLLAWTKTWEVVLTAGAISVSYPRLVPTFFAATFANYTTPFGQAGGEPFIAYVLATDTEASYEQALASVSTADLLNLLPFFSFAALGLAALVLTGEIPPGTQPLVIGLAGIAVGVPLIVLVGWYRRDLIEGAIMGVTGPVVRRTDRFSPEGVRERVDGFYDQLGRIASDPRELLVAVTFSFVGWVFFALPLYFAALALSLPLDPLLVVFLVPASSLAGITPTPGGLGGVEAALVALVVALTPIAAGPTAALAIAYRATSYWFALAVGGPMALYVTARA
ncbi:TIGR00374 family protein [Halobacteriales archaeon QS_3_64_16]|nr:MAG: TIGR00374 family protein [Halobacteriales archaeon QS_3_64_16]